MPSGVGSTGNGAATEGKHVKVATTLRPVATQGFNSPRTHNGLRFYNIFQVAILLYPSRAGLAPVATPSR